MRTYQREHYKLKAYDDDEMCKMIVEDDILHTSSEKYDKLEILYPEAKKLVREGKRVEIWNFKYEFIP